MKKPKVISSREVYNGWLNLRVDTLKVPGLKEKYDYDIVTIGDGVGVLPFLDKDNVILARQYRPPLKIEVLELIQGGLGMDILPSNAAARELKEETGYSGNINYLTTIYPLPGSLDMRLHLFYATDLKRVWKPENNPLEKLTLVKVPFKQILQEILEGKQKDSALVASALFYQLKQDKKS